MEVVSVDRRLARIVVMLFPASQACAHAARPPALDTGYLGMARALGDTIVVRGELGERMDAYLRNVSRFGFSGSVLVADSSGIIVHNGYGFANRTTGQPMTPATIADMGSITKIFTGAAILPAPTVTFHLPTGPVVARRVDLAPAPAH